MKEPIKLIEDIEIYQRAASEFMELLLNSDDEVMPYYNILDLVYNAHKHSIARLNSLKELLSNEGKDEKNKL